MPQEALNRRDAAAGIEELGCEAMTKYYGVYPAEGGAGSQRIAMRTGESVYYLLSDQLGSTSITTDGSGTKISELRYKACPLRCAAGVLREGEVRYTQGVTPTDYTYTGQYSQMDEVGLMFYNARWYDPYLNRWTQPDTIVPDPYNPQSLDRYSYTLNNPVRYTDPTGQWECESADTCDHIHAPNLSPGIRLVTENRRGSCGGGLMPECIQRHNDLVDDIETYMYLHPEYQPGNDPVLNDPGWPNRMNRFKDLREEYWMGRTTGGLEEAYRYMFYYDFHQAQYVTKWDSSRVDWTNTGLDSASTVLSVLALNEVTEFLKAGRVIQGGATYGSFATGFVSGYRSAKAKDPVGVALTVGGFVPGIGAGFSAVSAIRDLSAGLYNEQWAPAAPR